MTRMEELQLQYDTFLTQNALPEVCAEELLLQIHDALRGDREDSLIPDTTYVYRWQTTWLSDFILDWAEMERNL